MPLYICNAVPGAISDSAKEKIATDITRIHCDVTGAPSTFVHAFFFENFWMHPLDGKTIYLFGNIRHGRTDHQKAQIIKDMRDAIQLHTLTPLDDIRVETADIPASWVMEGGDLLPEPGEEGAWLAAHKEKMAAIGQTE